MALHPAHSPPSGARREVPMKRTSILLLAAFAALTLTLSDLADAARMGGGRSFGAQRQSVTPSKSAPPAAAPANNAAAQPTTPAAGTTPAPADAPSGASRWLGPIAGIAAGLGLAALLSHFGLSEGFGSLLLVALVVLAGIVLFRMLMRRRDTARAPLQYAGASAGDSIRPGYENEARPVWSDAPKMETGV